MICGTKKDSGGELTEEQVCILKALSQAKEPCSTKDIAAATGLESKAIGNRLTALKKSGLVASPVRCRYVVTAAGKTVLS